MNSKTKRVAKDILFKFFSWPFDFGIDSEPRILGYHSIGDGQSKISTPAERFRKQIEWLLAHGWRIYTLRDWWNLTIAEGKPPKRSAVLTFDDGFRGVFLNAAPILADYGLAGTVFLVAEAIGQSNAFDCARGVPQLALMGWDEIFKLKNMGWDIQSHGKRHNPMAGVSRESLEDEIVGSKNLIEKKLGGRVDFFCYPYGVFDEEAVMIVERAGYRAAVTCWAGTASNEAIFHRYRLRRVMADGLHSESDLAFRFSPAYRKLSKIWFWGRHKLGRDSECLLSEFDKTFNRILPTT